MAKKKPEETSDLEECKEKIKAILREYNCRLTDGEEGTHVLLHDVDTLETTNVNY
jgi:hypothetical protein